MADALPDLSETVELAVGGRLYAGWTDVSAEVRLDAMSGSFSLSLSSKADAAGAAIVIQDGDACQLRLGGETVIDGWIDAVTVTIGPDDHSVQVEGRDKTADLADCSAIHKPGSWRNAKIEAIAGELAKPFGVSVTASVSTGAPLPKFALQQGETVGAAIERLLRFRGLIAIATAKGDLEITTPDTGAPIGTLEQGVNIEQASGRRDQRERYSDYVVKGQAAGNDQKNGKTVSQIRGEAKDVGVKRYRPLLIVAEEQGDGASAQTRARYEAGVRAGKSRSADITTPGWRVAPKGALWRPNRRVKVKAPLIDIADEVMLIAGVRYAKNVSEGTTATITVAPPGAWAQLAEGNPK